jgi:hypothetical protein
MIGPNYPGQVSSSHSARTCCCYSTLGQANDMLSKGLISDAEYESLKARIVSTM